MDEGICSWCLARFLSVRGAAGVVSVGDGGSAASSQPDASMVVDEGVLDRGYFLATVLPALLSSLSGGVRSLEMEGGRTGVVAVRVLRLSGGDIFLERKFMVPRAEVVKCRGGKWGCGFAQIARRQVGRCWREGDSDGAG